MIRIFNDIIYVTSSYDHHASINTMIFYTLLTDQFDFIITTASPFHVNDGAALFSLQVSSRSWISFAGAL